MKRIFGVVFVFVSTLICSATSRATEPLSVDAEFVEYMAWLLSEEGPEAVDHLLNPNGVGTTEQGDSHDDPIDILAWDWGSGKPSVNISDEEINCIQFGEGQRGATPSESAADKLEILADKQQNIELILLFAQSVGANEREALELLDELFFGHLPSENAAAVDHSSTLQSRTSRVEERVEKSGPVRVRVKIKRPSA